MSGWTSEELQGQMMRGAPENAFERLLARDTDWSVELAPAYGFSDANEPQPESRKAPTAVSQIWRPLTQTGGRPAGSLPFYPPGGVALRTIFSQRTQFSPRSVDWDTAPLMTHRQVPVWAATPKRQPKTRGYIWNEWMNELINEYLIWLKM